MSTSTVATPDRSDRLSMRERMHVPRSRGATSGLLLVLLGLWGALVPLAGPWFDFAFTPDTTWDLTYPRLWLEVLPGAAAVLGGLILLGSANRVGGAVGAWLGIAAGAWFVVGRTVSQLWNDGAPQGGQPTATSTVGRVVEQLAFFEGLGALVLFLAAGALGRLSVVGVRDVRHARVLARERERDQVLREERERELEREKALRDERERERERDVVAGDRTRVVAAGEPAYDGTRGPEEPAHRRPVPADETQPIDPRSRR